MQSTKYQLTRTDVEKWAKNTLLFSAPAILALLIGLQAGKSAEVAVYMAYQALLASLIDLVRKFVSGPTT